MDILRTYSFIKLCIDHVIKEENIIFKASENAPSTFKGIKEYFSKNSEYMVYNGGDHGYLEEYNIKFRAVHDYMHIKYDLSFRFEDEKKLSDITARKFASIAYNHFNCTHYDMACIMRVINAEIKGQIEYYELNNSYVVDQKHFINDYLEEIA